MVVNELNVNSALVFALSTDGFMNGIKWSIHVHCVVLLSEVLLSRVRSLFFFVSRRIV